ncbi:MAG: hypothetical protein CVV22_03590 [Ignavibacteriae bacterium HGW-Ignavibacteriae-1]|jgi:hypothetical protein|nr:MAG: hypothetical protein CVV22_03590 [Ignavibacteriae bacterium HGW-Ignavibacteriae-1]
MLSHRKFCELAFVLLLAFTVSSYGQADKQINKSYFGFFLSGGIGFHDTETKALFGPPSCCNENLGESGLYIGYGAEYIYNFSSKMSFTFSTGFEKYKVDFMSPEKMILNIDGEPIEGLFNHNTAFDINFLAVQMGLMYEFYHDFLVSVQLGSIFHLSNSITQYEELKEPDDRGVFPDSGTRVRNRRSGEIINISTFIPTGELAIHKRLPLSMNSTSFLQISGSVNYVPFEIVENTEWTILTFKLKASFYFPI